MALISFVQRQMSSQSVSPPVSQSNSQPVVPGCVTRSWFEREIDLPVIGQVRWTRYGGREESRKVGMEGERKGEVTCTKV